MALARSTLFLIGICALSISAQPSGRIWGGEETSKYALPHVASVRLDNAHTCGGSIVGDKAILTAAHCVVKDGKAVSASRVSVRVGSLNQFSGGVVHYVSKITLHPDYEGVKNDIAVLTLEKDLEWSNRINKVLLSTDLGDQTGKKVTVTGWGSQIGSGSAYKLRSISLSVATADDCKDAYNDADETTICMVHALKEGSCYGDAGNGAIYENYLIAVSSFVVGACGSRYPEVFTNVAHYASWIESVIV